MNLKKTMRKVLCGIDDDYRLIGCREPMVQNEKVRNLYIHIPFCQSLCPYCPYNKIPYQRKYAKPYLDAMLKEIEMYSSRVSEWDLTSIYIGGGTPTLLLDELAVVLERIKGFGGNIEEICVETSPADMTNEKCEKMRQMGVNKVSLGIQSFNDTFLETIGRNYRSDILQEKIDIVLSAGFESVNADMLFALPNQSVGELIADMKMVLAAGFEQVTIYPLFTFPYSSVEAYQKTKKVKRPSLFKRKKHFFALRDFFEANGFERSSIWSYKKPGTGRYSSATRERYIGFGAGAGSHTQRGFYINTFSVDGYIGACDRGEFPSAMHMPFSERMQNFLWLYWRLYDTYVSKDGLRKRFGTGDKYLNRVLSTLRILGWLKQNETDYYLTGEGAFWVHMMQNNVLLGYINAVWGGGYKEAWPEVIELD